MKIRDLVEDLRKTRKPWFRKVHICAHLHSGFFCAFCLSVPSKHCCYAWGFFYLINLRILEQTLEKHFPQLKIQQGPWPRIGHSRKHAQNIGKQALPRSALAGMKAKAQVSGTVVGESLARWAPQQLAEARWLCPRGTGCCLEQCNFGVDSQNLSGMLWASSLMLLINSGTTYAT